MKTKILRPFAYSILCFLVLALGLNSTANATVYFVRLSGSDLNPGFSWALSFKTLTRALAIAGPGDVINVAQGTYLPTSTLDVSASFTIPSQVIVYGGYAPAGNPLFADRDFKKYPTILSGDLNGDGLKPGNSNSVVQFNNVAPGTILDGVIIEQGNATVDGYGGGITNHADDFNTSSPVVRNCTFRYHLSYGNINGSTVTNVGSVSTTYSYCHFHNNSGDITFSNASPDQNVAIDHCVFMNNDARFEINGSSNLADPKVPLKKRLFIGNSLFIAASKAVAIIYAFNNYSDTINTIIEQSVFIGGVWGVYMDNFLDKQQRDNRIFLTGCTFAQQTRNAVGTFYEPLHAASHTSMKNCTIDAPLLLTPFYEDFYISYSNFGSRFNGYTDEHLASGPGNLNIAPAFLNPASPLGSDGIFGTADDGYNLVDCSPGINQGTNNADTNALDAAGLPRVYNSQRDMGAYEFQSVPQVSQLARANDVATRYVYAGNNVLLDDSSNCGLIASILPTGGAAINGKVAAKVHIDPTVQVHNGIPYLQRHVDIEPATNAARATATVTIYCTQAEFNAFNAVRGSFPHLPMSPGDAAGKANLRISQCHGTSTLFVPGSYSGPTELIDPGNTNVSWNSTSNRWEIRFNVTGFSGFFIHTGLVALPLHLGSFTGVHHSGDNILSWMTLSEMNTASFMVQRSTDGIKFVTIATIPAAGNSSLPRNYTFTDNHFTSALNYYRLQMIDINGSYTFSSVIALRGQSSSTISVSPNPFSNIINVEIPSQTGGHSTLALLDGNGRSVLSKKLVLQSGTNVVAIPVPAGTAPGLYVLRIEENNHVSFLKLIKM